MMRTTSKGRAGGGKYQKEGRTMEDNVTVFIWLGLLILFLVIEIATVGLTTIWMAGGTLGAIILDLVGLNLWWQTEPSWLSHS